MPWYPEGYSEASNDADVAWRWEENPECGSEGTYCWRIRVLTNKDCENLYGQLSVQDGNTVLDYMNDTLGALHPGQEGVLTFEWYSGQESYGELTGDVSEINCY